MVGCKTARRQSHCDRTEQCCQQGDQVQELLSPLQGLPQLRAATLQRLHPHAAHGAVFNLALCPGHEGVDSSVLPRHGLAVGQPAGRLHQAGGGQVGAVNHHARRKIHEASTTVGLIHDQPCHPQAGVPQQQLIAQRQAQGFEQWGLHPGLAGRRDVARQITCTLGLCGHPQPAAQRVAGCDHLQGHQLAVAAPGLGGARHGRKTQGLHHLQPQAPGFGLKGRRRRVVADDHRVTTQQLPRIALHAALQAVSKKAHSRQGRHRQRHRQHQQTQLTRAQVAPQGAAAQLPKRDFHGARLAPKAWTGSMQGLGWAGELSLWTLQKHAGCARANESGTQLATVAVNLTPRARHTR